MHHELLGGTIRKGEQEVFSWFERVAITFCLVA